jgi:cephalosporin-C deacetylase-like acetyl esterase
MGTSQRTKRFVAESSLLVSITALFAALLSGAAQDSHLADVRHFDYDRGASVDLKESSVQERAGATVHNITYQSSDGRTVPAYLVVPKDGVKLAAILWGHWLMQGSPTANRTEFLDEAVAMAPAGVVSLLIDAPQARLGFVLEHKPLGAKPSELIAEQVMDLRRAIDLLLSRPDVDAKRIAYVGHSWDARTGAILDAVDKRLVAFVFMGGPISTRDNILTSDAPNLVAMRKAVPAETLKAFLDTYEWADAGTYASHLGPAPALFQYALHDDFSPVKYAKQYAELSSGPKEVKFYDADHALNAQARQDRFIFLHEHLGLRDLPAGGLEKVPNVK